VGDLQREFKIRREDLPDLTRPSEDELSCCLAGFGQLSAIDRSLWARLVAGVARHGGILPFHPGTNEGPSKAAANVAFLQTLGLLGPPRHGGSDGRWACQLTAAAWRLLLDGRLDPDLAREAQELAQGPWNGLSEGERAVLGSLLREAARDGGEISIDVVPKVSATEGEYYDEENSPDKPIARRAFVAASVLQMAEEFKVIEVEELPPVAALVPVPRRGRLTPLGWQFVRAGHTNGWKDANGRPASVRRRAG
jgi:hypothetical protein